MKDDYTTNSQYLTYAFQRLVECMHEDQTWRNRIAMEKIDVDSTHPSEVSDLRALTYYDPRLTQIRSEARPSAIRDSLEYDPRFTRLRSETHPSIRDSAKYYRGSAEYHPRPTRERSKTNPNTIRSSPECHPRLTRIRSEIHPIAILNPPEYPRLSQVLSRLSRIPSETHTRTIQDQPEYDPKLNGVSETHPSIRWDPPENDPKLTRVWIDTQPILVWCSRHCKGAVLCVDRVAVCVSQVDTQFVRAGCCQAIYLIQAQPELAAQVSKPSSIIFPATVEIHRAVQSLLEHRPAPSSRGQVTEHVEGTSIIGFDRVHAACFVSVLYHVCTISLNTQSWSKVMVHLAFFDNFTVPSPLPPVQCWVSALKVSPLKQHCMGGGGGPSLGKRAAFIIEQGAIMKTKQIFKVYHILLTRIVAIRRVEWMCP